MARSPTALVLLLLILSGLGYYAYQQLLEQQERAVIGHEARWLSRYLYKYGHDTPLAELAAKLREEQDIGIDLEKWKKGSYTDPDKANDGPVVYRQWIPNRWMILHPNGHAEWLYVVSPDADEPAEVPPGVVPLE